MYKPEAVVLMISTARNSFGRDDANRSDARVAATDYLAKPSETLCNHFARHPAERERHRPSVSTTTRLDIDCACDGFAQRLAVSETTGIICMVCGDGVSRTAWSPAL